MPDQPTDTPLEPELSDPGEDEAFLRAIQEGESSERVSREEVFAYLNHCAGYGDYTAERAEMFAGLSVDDIIAEIKQGRGQAATPPASSE